MQDVSGAAPGLALSESELLELGVACETHSPLDLDALSGLFHALGVTPGHVEASSWLKVVFPELAGMGADASRMLTLALRRYTEVVTSLVDGVVSTPPHQDEQRCVSFASGYVMGARLDPKWAGDERAWRLARDMAYLAGRTDLLSADEVRQIEEELEPDPKTTIREEMRGIIRAAYATFREAEWPSVNVSRKVGRNDPCPCGSGKKFKKCCIDVDLH